MSTPTEPGRPEDAGDRKRAAQSPEPANEGVAQPVGDQSARSQKDGPAETEGSESAGTDAKEKAHLLKSTAG